MYFLKEELSNEMARIFCVVGHHNFNPSIIFHSTSLWLGVIMSEPLKDILCAIVAGAFMFFLIWLSNREPKKQEEK